MDFIYSRLNNNLIDINRLDTITLLKCEQDGEPISRLKIGDYYLKFTVVDSDKISYCDLSNLTKDNKDILDKLYKEQERAETRENEVEKTSANNLTISQDEETGIITIELLNIHGDVLDTKTLDLETEKIIRSIDLDYENKKLIFHLVDRTVIETDITDIVDRCLYKSTTNASRWESKEGSFTGYLGNSSKTAVKAKVGLNIESSSPYLPSYPTVWGTYNVLNNEENSLTGKLNLTPINSNASPLFTFTGSGTLSMGQRNIYLDSSWFTQSTNNINLCIPAKSGTLITVADAMGSFDIEVDDIDVTKIKLTDSQYNYLLKYPKSTFALKYSEGGYWGNDEYRYFTKVYDYLNGRGAYYGTSPSSAKFITLVNENKIGYANIIAEENDEEKKELYLNITYTNITSQEELKEVKKLLDQEILDRESGDETEKTRAEGEEANLKKAITEEQTVRQQSDTILNSAINSVKKDLTTNVNTLKTYIQTETNNRTLSDAILQQNIDSEAKTREESDKTLQTNIDNEITDRKEAINQLIDELTAAKEVIDGTLNTEVENRKAADEVIKEDLNTEITRAKEKETSIENNLSTEITNRETGDSNTLTSAKQYTDEKISTEETRAISAEEALAERITKEVNDGYNWAVGKFEEEAKAREYADATLQSNIDAEATSRKISDNTLTATLNSEISRAVGKEAELGSSISTINTKIPTEASSTNLLADRNWVSTNAGKIDSVSVEDVKKEIIDKNVNLTLSDFGMILTDKSTPVVTKTKNFATIDTIFSGSQNGIELSLIKDYDILVVQGYKENVQTPNTSTFVLTKDIINNPSSWSMRLIANSWEYTLLLVSDGTKLYFYSNLDYSDSTIFMLTNIIGIKGV